MTGIMVAIAPPTHGAHREPVELGDWLVPALVIAVAGVTYLVGARVYRSRRARPWGPWRTGSWLTGVAMVALAISPAMWTIDSEVRGHMVQHLLLGMFGPLALALGAPLSLLLATAPRQLGQAVAGLLRNPAFHVAGHPITAAVLHVGGMFALYLTPLYAQAMRHEPVHHLVHLHFLIAGYLFAWSIAGPDPAPRRPGLGVRLGVLVVAAAAHSYLGKLLYARAGEFPPTAEYAASDVEIAAQWMFYGGDIAELLLVVALFTLWYRRAGRTRMITRGVSARA